MDILNCDDYDLQLNQLCEDVERENNEDKQLYNVCENLSQHQYNISSQDGGGLKRQTTTSEIEECPPTKKKYGPSTSRYDETTPPQASDTNRPSGRCRRACVGCEKKTASTLSPSRDQDANLLRYQDCLAKYSNFPYDAGSSYCNATFDGYLCWPPTRAGEPSYQPCPRERLSDTSREFIKQGLAFRRCGESGIWMGKPSHEKINPLGWTNFTPCFPPQVQTLLDKVYEDNESAQLKFEVAERTRYMEIVGFSISLVALIISLVIFSYYRSLRNNRTRIHKSLFTAMVLQVFIRLTLYIDQAFIRSKHGDHYPYDNTTSYSPVRGIDNMPYLCESSYVLLEYAITVMFMWMFIEGLYLHNVVTANALRERISHLMFYATGWGLPVIVTIIWASLTAIHYQKENVKQCWYGYNFSQLYWIVQGPRLAVILVNLVFLLNIMRVLIMKLRQSENTEVEKVRKAVRAALVLLPLLGITNVLNMTEAPLDGNVWKFRLWSYGTHFLRSFQGFFISLIYCFLNGEVRQVVQKHYNNYMAMRVNTRRHRDSLFHFMSSSGENRQPRTQNNDSEDKEACFPMNTLRLTAPAPFNNADTNLRGECSKQNNKPKDNETCYPLNTLNLTPPANFYETSDTDLRAQCKHEAD